MFAVSDLATAGMTPDTSVRVLLVHNFYQNAGGEDQSFAADKAMLEKYGHEVSTFTLSNDLVKGMGRLKAAGKAMWNAECYRDLRRVIRENKPQVVHFANIFAVISPAAYYAAHAEGAAVVQTLHNFRLICPSAILFRDGAVCEDCLGKSFAWPGIVHGCYRGSRLASAAVATMLATHRLVGTWRREVDAYIALNNFVYAKYLKAGINPEQLFVSPNYLRSDLKPGCGDSGFALFAGRLTPEKGIRTLLEAWSRLPGDIMLKIAGDGADADLVRAAAEVNPNIEWLGWRHQEEVVELAGRATCVIIPSLWYEGFNRVILEAFAQGTPVVASDMGSMKVIVDHGRTGLLFRPGDPDDLAAKVAGLMADPALRRTMRLAARAEFEDVYTEDANYDRLLRIYEFARHRMRRQTA
jgi:glycosyltransferase involved in cell wall biosynthesis